MSLVIGAMKRKKAPYRHKQEIMFLICESAKSPKTRTRILYETLISWEQTNAYCSELIHFGLLRYNTTSGTYVTTPKGLRFVELYSRLKEELENNDE